jgi:hypothetical protein
VLIIVSNTVDESPCVRRIGVYIDHRVCEKGSLRALNISRGSLVFEAAPCAWWTTT